MPGRKFVSGEGYRFGFNGKEDDRDWGTQNIQDYGFRLYNPSIGKFLSVDPLAKDYPELTCYQFASNTPIQAIDLDGLEAINAQDIDKHGLEGTGIKITNDTYIIMFSHTYNPNRYISWTANIEFRKAGLSLHDLITINSRNSNTFLKGLELVYISGNRSDLGIFNHIHNFYKVEKLAGPLDQLGAAFLPYTGESKSDWNGIAINTYRHIFGQALLTIIAGESFAKYTGDAHERDPEGFVKTTKEINRNDSYADVINNYYGRKKGKEYMKKNKIDASTIWTEEMTADFMNYIGDYTLNSFKETNGSKSDFKITDDVVKTLTKAINEAVKK